jgi:hypothetical protein
MVRETSDVAEYFALGLLILGLASWLVAQAVRSVPPEPAVAVSMVLLVAAALLGVVSETNAGRTIGLTSAGLFYVYLGLSLFGATRQLPKAHILLPVGRGELDAPAGIDDKLVGRREVAEPQGPEVRQLPVVYERVAPQELVPNLGESPAVIFEHSGCSPRLSYGRDVDEQSGSRHRGRSALITQLTVQPRGDFLVVQAVARGKTWRGLPPLRWRRAEVRTVILLRCERNDDTCIIGADPAGTFEAKGDGIHIIVEPAIKAEGHRLEIGVVVRVGLNPQGGPTDTTIGVPGTPIKQSWSWTTADHQSSLNGGTHIWDCVRIRR